MKKREKLNQSLFLFGIIKRDESKKNLSVIINLLINYSSFFLLILQIILKELFFHPAALYLSFQAIIVCLISSPLSPFIDFSLK